MVRTHERQGEEYDERPARPDDQQGEGADAERGARHDARHGGLGAPGQGPVDLAPAADQIMRVLPVVSDDLLQTPTPCDGRTVAQLAGHLVGLTRAFRAAAQKDLGELTDHNPDEAGWPAAEEGWRERLAEQLPALVTAWYPHQAWEGMTRAGGVDLPAAAAGVVALSELTLHGWDLARATGRSYECDESTVAVLEPFIEGFDPAGTPGLFGPAVEPPEDANRFDRLLARSGRDPRWHTGQAS